MKFELGEGFPFVQGVTPHAGVWIEISYLLGYLFKVSVTPHAGVWIEISQGRGKDVSLAVTPHAGVWIEIRDSTVTWGTSSSPPTRGCGLKFDGGLVYSACRGHPPRGGVD